MFKLRLITALILIPVIIIALFSLSMIEFSIAILAISVLAAWEWSSLARLSSYLRRIIFTISCGMVLLGCMLDLLYNMQDGRHSLHFSKFLWIALCWWIIVIPLVYYYPKSAIVWRNSCILRVLFGFFTIFSFFYGMLSIRQYNYVIDHNTGVWQLFYFLMLVWGADSGAYVFGKLFGNYKLAPQLSSGKTWEGLIGGLFVSCSMVYLFSALSLTSIPCMPLLFYSLIVVLASVLGDLSESMFKREAAVKDSGKILPGHGGILDRIDSLAAAAPVFASLQWLICGVF
ncbi:phosphatidate cytidylyltransferase [Candidatus Erwinia haradaeae]|uniref:Phosphatidate cytidylyltransferase n=1 Tax=Candidatus Erwinia haradaeae TaxID=1922217 RepID=A0A451D9G6_9GAMM|nr:phosphatidate cytidylyltransferase [Candidatus Erwinia haradaeae]VFP82954.1 Phosphatidate cytidylyltransferase [Candidatus Erwinia haradaeae]